MPALFTRETVLLKGKAHQSRTLQRTAKKEYTPAGGVADDELGLQKWSRTVPVALA